MNPDSRETLLTHLMEDEGFVPHVYQDHLGFWTLGFGRLVDKRRGGGISLDEGLYLLRNDVDRFEQAVLSRFPWVAWMDDVRMIAVMNLAFNLGIDGLANFRNTLAAMQQSDWAAVEDGLRKSLWFRQVQKSRSDRIIHMFRTGTFPHA